MENQKNDKGFIVFVCVVVLAFVGFIVYEKVLSKPEQKPVEKPNIIDNNNNSQIEETPTEPEEEPVEKPNIIDNNNNSQIEETPIDNVVIKNTEVKELYNYVQPSLNSNWVCLGYFYQNPYKNHTLTNKVALVLINYAEKYKKKIDNNFLKKVSPSDRDSIKTSSEYYVEASVVKNGLKLLYNIDIDKFDENSNYMWAYISDADAFIELMGGGDYPAEIFQQIIDYNELSDEINLTVAKAEIDYDNNVYRYACEDDKLVFNNYSGEFKFTKENVNKFPQLKYVFKKNSNGKYYVSDIINLNFEQDFEECD